MAMQSGILLLSLIVSNDTIMTKGAWKPPYRITAGIIDLIVSISEKTGRVNAAHLYKPPAELRRRTRIRTIQSSLEIKGNSLSMEQVTAILDNKWVAAPRKDILEVKNAIAVY